MSVGKFPLGGEGGTAIIFSWGYCVTLGLQEPLRILDHVNLYFATLFYSQHRTSYPTLDLFPDLLMLTGLRKVAVLPAYQFLNVIYQETFSN